MSFTGAISSSLGGLAVATRKAEIVSANIAGALTEGYGRRSVAVSSDRLGALRVEGIVRHVDPAILGDRRLAEADVSAGQQTADMLLRLERLLGQIGEDSALTSQLSQFETALVSATADPSSEVRQNVVIDRLKQLTGALNTTADGIQALRMEVETDIALQVDTLNDSLVRIEKLNGEISTLANKGIDVSSLLDERQRAIDTISAMVPVREVNRGNHQIALITPSGQSLLDGHRAEFGFTKATMITADMSLASGGLSGLTVNGMPLADATGRLGGGTLGSAFALRDQILPDAQSQVDAVARSLIERFQDGATDPTLGPADAGLLTDAGARFDPLNTDGLAARIAVNAAVDPAAGGEVWRIRDGVMATVQGPVGSSAQLNRWLDSVQEARATHLGGAPSSVSGHLANFLADIGAQRLSADRDLAYQTARWNTLREAEMAGGVDTDVELQNLLQIEQAYTANAKVLQAIDQMMQRLMEI